MIDYTLKEIGVQDYTLQSYGSSINGLALSKDESDLDLSLTISDKKGDFLSMEEFDTIFASIIQVLQAQNFVNEYSKKESSRYRVNLYPASFGKLL